MREVGTVTGLKVKGRPKAMSALILDQRRDVSGANFTLCLSLARSAEP
jgi:hypothetical protein